MERFRSIELPADGFDLVVAIANGGLIPAGIINQRLELPIAVLHLNLKDKNQQLRYDTPQLISPIDFAFKGKRLLLVDDRIKSGTTIDKARELLAEAQSIRTFAVNGTADYALFDEACFRFPWIP